MSRNTSKSAGAVFRAAYDQDFEVENPGDTVILERCVALLDQLERMEGQLETDGLMSAGGNGQPVVSPLLAAIRAHSAELARLVRALGMQPESIHTQRARKAADARWKKSS